MILGHTFYYQLKGPFQNIMWPVELFDQFSFSLVLSAPYSVDIFFWLSGFLGGYIMLQTMRKKGGRMEPYYMIVLHRFLRLWPMYIGTLLLYWAVMPLFLSGPISFMYQ